VKKLENSGDKAAQIKENVVTKNLREIQEKDKKIEAL